MFVSDSVGLKVGHISVTLASQFLLDGTWRVEVIIEAPAVLREVDRSLPSSSLPWRVKGVPDTSFWPNRVIWAVLQVLGEQCNSIFLDRGFQIKAG